MIRNIGIPITSLPDLEPIQDVITQFGSVDDSIPVRDITVADGPDHIFHYQDAPLRLSETASVGFYRAMGIPLSYAKRCPSRLLASQVRHWVETDSRVGEGTFLINREDREATKFLPRGSSPVPVRALLETAAELVPSLRVRSFIQTTRDFTISLVDVEREYRITPEDFLYGGMTVQGSFVESKAVLFDGYIFRLVCSNGLITAADRKITKHLSGSESRMVAKMRETIEGVLATLPSKFEALKQTTELPAPDRESLISSLRTLAKIRTSVADRIREQYVSNPPESLYDAINLVTALGQEFVNSPRVARQTEELGGVLLSHHQLCSTCGRLQ